MIRHDRGFALFVVIATMATLTLLSTTMFMALHRALDRERAARDADVVRLLAMAGLHKAAAELAVGTGTYKGENHTPLGEGEFTVVVRAGDTANSYRARATGALTDGARVLRSCTLAAELRVDSNGVVAITRIARVARDAVRQGGAKP